MLNQPELGKIIRSKREKLGLTLTHVAEMSLIFHPALIDIEKGRRYPKPGVLLYLCEILSLNPITLSDLPFNRVIGIDPGSLSGALTVINLIKGIIVTHDLDLLALEIPDKNDIVYVEKVGSLPHDSNRASFSFGHNCGQIDGVLYANRVKFSLVTPQDWQAPMWSRISRKEYTDKHAKNKFAVKSYFPKSDIPQRHEASLLIALYGLYDYLRTHSIDTFQLLHEFKFNEILEKLK